MCLWLCSRDSGTWHSPHRCTFWLNRWRRKGGRPHHQVAGNSRFLSFVYSFYSCNWVYLYIVFVLLYSVCHSLCQCHCHCFFLLLCVDVIQFFTCLLCVRAISQYNVGDPSIPTSVLFPRDSVSYAVGYSIKLAIVTGFFFLCVRTSFSHLHVFCGSFYFNVPKRCDEGAQEKARGHTNCLSYMPAEKQQPEKLLAAAHLLLPTSSLLVSSYSRPFTVLIIIRHHISPSTESNWIVLYISLSFLRRERCTKLFSYFLGQCFNNANWVRFSERKGFQGRF